jgi:hypothetical protein
VNSNGTNLFLTNYFDLGVSVCNAHIPHTQTQTQNTHKTHTKHTQNTHKTHTQNTHKTHTQNTQTKHTQNTQTKHTHKTHTNTNITHNSHNILYVIEFISIIKIAHEKSWNDHQELVLSTSLVSNRRGNST